MVSILFWMCGQIVLPQSLTKVLLCSFFDFWKLRLLVVKRKTDETPQTLNGANLCLEPRGKERSNIKLNFKILSYSVCFCGTLTSPKSSDRRTLCIQYCRLTLGDGSRITALTSDIFPPTNPSRLLSPHTSSGAIKKNGKQAELSSQLISSICR